MKPGNPRALPRQRGVAMLELSVTLPLLLAICFSIVEFGRAIYTYNTLAKSARDAVRYLTTQAAGDTDAWATARNLMTYGNPAGTGSPLLPSLDATNMGDRIVIHDASNNASNLNQGTNPAINTVTVTVTGYQFTPLIDLLAMTRFYTGGSSSIVSITFGDISATMRQS